MADYANLEIGLYYGSADSYILELRFHDPDAATDESAHRWPVQLSIVDLIQEQLDPEAYGQRLTDSLFAEPGAKAELEKACVRTLDQEKNLRLRLYIDRTVPELHDLRWEMLRDPRNGAALLTNQRILFSRFARSSDSRPVRLRARRGDLRALAVIASPANATTYKHLDDGRQFAEVKVQEELQRARDGLGALLKSEHDVIASDPAAPGRATLSNLIGALRGGYDILYLVCHGMLRSKGQGPKEPYLMLEQEDGRADFARGLDLVGAIRDLPHQPQLVVLASCQSAGQGEPRSDDQEGALAALGPRLADAGIPAVLAMQGDVFMETAAQFMPVFFKQLGEHGQIDRAMAAARSAAVLNKRPDWWMPALFMRLREGRIWYVPGFRSGDKETFEKWPALLTRIDEGKDADTPRCTPILGFGLIESLLGSSRDIAQRWADTFHFPMESHSREDLPQVAQYLVDHQDLNFPYDELRRYLHGEILKNYRDQLPEALREAKVGKLDQIVEALGIVRRQQNPDDPYQVLAKLPFSIYVTTNPDNLLSKALEEAGKTPHVALCPWNADIDRADSIYEGEPTVDEPLVYHLFGQMRKPESLVLTEDDYFDYLIGVTSNRSLIPDSVLRALNDSLLLFLGFRLEDWNFRVLFRNIMGRSGRGRLDRYAHVAVQLDPEEGRIPEPERARRYLEKYFGRAAISIFWGSAEDFVRDLRAQWNERYGGEMQI